MASVRDRVSETEWQTRVDLAAAYRLIALNGWDDGIFTHNSARIPGVSNQFLINPYGMLFEEVTASCLIKVDMDGTFIDADEDADIIDAGFTIHSGVLMARPDVNSVMHTHTRAGMAVSAQAGGLLPITQTSLRFYNRVAYHDYEGIADDLDERDRLARDLGNKSSVILRNHGLLTAGRSIADAFSLLRYLENACESQIAAQAGGGELTMPPADVCEHAALQFEASGHNQRSCEASFAAYKRKLDRLDPSYAE